MSCDDVLFRMRTEWLLDIGRRLRIEYDAAAKPLPQNLAVLLKQLETRAPDSGQTREDAQKANS
jgi:hypothetical protein